MSALAKEGTQAFISCTCLDGSTMRIRRRDIIAWREYPGGECYIWVHGLTTVDDPLRLAMLASEIAFLMGEK